MNNNGQIYNKAHFLSEFVCLLTCYRAQKLRRVFSNVHIIIGLPQTKELVFPSQTVLLISLPGYVIPRSAERNTPWSLLTLHHFPPILSYNKIKYNTDMHALGSITSHFVPNGWKSSLVVHSYCKSVHEKWETPRSCNKVSQFCLGKQWTNKVNDGTQPQSKRAAKYRSTMKLEVLKGFEPT